MIFNKKYIIDRFNKFYTSTFEFLNTWITDKTLSVFAFISVLIGVILLGTFVAFISCNLSWAWGRVDKDTMEITGNIGDFFGGILGSFWALAGVFLLYLTLKMQKTELGNQKTELQNTREIFELQKFENTFFNLVANHKSLIENLTVVVNRCIPTPEYEVNTERVPINGSKVLEEIVSQMKLIKAGLEGLNERCDTGIFYTYNIEVYTCNVEVCLKDFEISAHDIFLYNSLNNDTEDAALKCGLIYSILFSQLGDEIGHYFRSLFHILLYIDETYSRMSATCNNEEDKQRIFKDFKKYADFLQAQMSSTELLVLFYNAVCYEKTRVLMNKYTFLENLSAEELLDESHNGVLGMKLEKRNSRLKEEVYRLFKQKK